jgi:phage tail-like protein
MVDGLETRHPIGFLLPALYHDDDFAQRFTSALDALMAPILTTLDCIDAYFDPGIAPSDFVGWLAEWVGIELDENWPMPRQRELVASAVELYEWQGTSQGLRRLVEIYTGVTPDIEESGGAAWASSPEGELPGSPDARVKVTVRVPDPSAVDVGRLDRIVARAKPAHVVHEVEVVTA